MTMRMKMFGAMGAIGAVATVATLAALTVADLTAQEPRRARRAGLEALQSEIGLNDQQVAEIRRIHSEARKAAIRRHADLRIARMELHELLAAATVDEAKIAARVKAISDLQAVAFKERTETQLAVRRLVTAEQYQKMQQAKRGAVRARRARPMRRPMAPEGEPGGPERGEDLAEVDPS
jgi:Spy/CpxP family protein refolding chaperone